MSLKPAAGYMGSAGVTPADIVASERYRKADAIGRICHEANRAYCQAIRDPVLGPWDQCGQHQRDTVRNGVLFHLDNPDAGPAASHENWRAFKAAAGWTLGPVRREDTKEHPCMVPFEEMPIEQQRKDMLFRAIVHALSD